MQLKKITKLGNINFKTNIVKIQKISNTLTPFGGIFLVNEKIEQCGLSKLIDKELGKRKSNIGYWFAPLLFGQFINHSANIEKKIICMQHNEQLMVIFKS
ncbi:MAG TPA: hypothetical protein PLW77_10400 [Bacteroidales bacterium]|nr:hypothetical protein [Bacteroidales bacterium]HQB21120.1 hypothetical protein [Bacteroidales bacterium]